MNKTVETGICILLAVALIAAGCLIPSAFITYIVLSDWDWLAFWKIELVCTLVLLIVLLLTGKREKTDNETLEKSE